jgi:ABC-type transport system involved in cytochrome bd biosynthesis fused ATPase/permease subunit
VRAAADAAGAMTLIDRLPNGFETLVRRGGTLLSGGERQRLVIARALLRNGSLWLLDEPTTGLDGDVASRLLDRLLHATHGRTTLWVTHDRALARRLEWCVELEAGRIVYCGPSSQWRTDPRLKLSPSLTT